MTGWCGPALAGPAQRVGRGKGFRQEYFGTEGIEVAVNCSRQGLTSPVDWWGVGLSGSWSSWGSASPLMTLLATLLAQAVGAEMMAGVQ